MAIAGKTGTTTSNKDVWFAGYTPYYTATTWTGFDNNEKLTGQETSLSKKMWKIVMSRLHENLEYKSFDIPAGITQVTVCSRSGYLPVSGLCDGYLRTEYFAEGTVPSQTCDVHYNGNICLATGLPACDTCPFKVPGIQELTHAEPASIGSSNGGTTRCPHDAAFFADPAHVAILQQQQAALAAQGYNFSIEGY
jgi:penicillin-binding protein 1A